MAKKAILVDVARCIGCNLCVEACHESHGILARPPRNSARIRSPLSKSAATTLSASSACTVKILPARRCVRLRHSRRPRLAR